MELETKKCPKCGQYNEMLPSNNPLINSTCGSCISRELDFNNAEHGDFFCRTYNIPFEPELWMRMAAEYKDNVFKEYAVFVHEDGNYETSTLDAWEIVNKEWELIQTHAELISAIKPIKEGFILRNHIKWGSNYVFEELISLENLFVKTLEANNVSNPMQVDAIKKACKLSVSLDRAIINGVAKEINDFSKAYQNFIKTAKIDDLITASSQDVISNIAEFVQFIEESGFKFNYYDDVSRDIVDKSLKDQQQFIRRLVMDSTGLSDVFETINTSLKTKNAIDKDASSYEAVPLEELYSEAIDKHNKEFDEELESDELNEDVFIEDDDEQEQHF